VDARSARLSMRPLAILLLLPMFLVMPEKPHENSARVIVFDVGQDWRRRSDS